jgi:hypothetical protein
MKSGRRNYLGIGRLCAFALILTPLLTLFASQSPAAIPERINYQGYLTNASGAPINGTIQMTFRIYDVLSGGSALWTETQNSVPLNYGVYNVNLGEVTPLNLAFDAPYFLEVQVGTEILSPRRAITSVGYAFRALTADVVGAHTHSGADITSGTVAEQRIDSAIARTSALIAHISNTNNPHSTTAVQVGAAPSVHTHNTKDITTGTLDNTLFSAYSNLASEGYLDNNAGADILTRSQADVLFVNEGQADSISAAMISVPLSLSGSLSGSGVVSGTNSNVSGRGVIGIATATGAVTNIGGYFQADGNSGRAISGYAPATGPATNIGGNFQAAGNSGRGVYGIGLAEGLVTNYGGYFTAVGGTGRGVYGEASDTGPYLNYGGYFTAAGLSGRGVFGAASGNSGRGVYGEASATGAGVANYGGYFTASGALGSGVRAEASGDSGRGIYATASAAGDVTNYGGYFVASGTTGRGVVGFASNSGEVEGEPKYGGYFQAAGSRGVGVGGYATGNFGIGVYGEASGQCAHAFYGLAPNTNGCTAAAAYFSSWSDLSTGVEAYGGHRGVYGKAWATGESGGYYGGEFLAMGDFGRGVSGEANGEHGYGVRGSGGAYDFYAYGPGANYGPFTGSHEVKLSRDFPDAVQPGMIVSVTGKTGMRKTGEGKISLSSTLPTVTLSKTVRDKAVFGIIVKESPLDKDHWYQPRDQERFAVVNALGEGRVWVTNLNGNIEAGDYITTSNIPGYGQRQDDDILRSYTLGKAIETVDWDLVTETVEYNGQRVKVYLLGVVYTSG